jgi:c-di-GMP-related signal transduction protein
MHLTYKFLYRNGHEDSFSQDLNVDEAELVNETIETSMREGVSAFISFGDGDTAGHLIRLGDVTRVTILNGGDSQ